MKRHLLLAASLALMLAWPARLGAQDPPATKLPVPDLSGLDMSDIDMSEPELPTLDLPALDLAEPDLPALDLPALDLPARRQPQPQLLPLEDGEIPGVWHGIDPGPGSFSAWEIEYRNDGTYQLRAFRRDFDIPVGDGPDTDDVTDGTWRLTEQGFLEFDGGEMLFQAIGRDGDKITYSASFPNEKQSPPWTVHEFRGPAPAAIFDLAPFTDREKTLPDPLQSQADNLRHLLLGCSVYAVEQGGQFPANLSAIARNIGAETLAKMKNFTDPDTGKQTPWTLLPGRRIDAPHDTVLMHSPASGGRRVVGLLDGTVLILDEEEFAAKTAGSAGAARD